jgi:hypothetical protein
MIHLGMIRLGYGHDVALLQGNLRQQFWIVLGHLTSLYC